MYNYSKFTQYAYLIAAILVTIEGFNQYQSGNTGNTIMMGFFAILAVFMFFFRRKFSKKFDSYNKKP